MSLWDLIAIQGFAAKQHLVRQAPRGLIDADLAVVNRFCPEMRAPAFVGASPWVRLEGLNDPMKKPKEALIDS